MSLTTYYLKKDSTIKFKCLSTKHVNHQTDGPIKITLYQWNRQLSRNELGIGGHRPLPSYCELLMINCYIRDIHSLLSTWGRISKLYGYCYGIVTMWFHVNIVYVAMDATYEITFIIYAGYLK